MRGLSFMCLLFPFTLFGQDAWKNVYTERAWKERDRWQQAEELIKELAIKSGDRVADIGCHEGYMTMKLSNVVGKTGEVYAVDVDQSRLDKLKEHASDRKIYNITPVKGDYDNPKLPYNTLNAVIIVDAYHEMEDHDVILRHIYAALKRGGRLILCEPIAEDRRNLSRAEQERKHELGMEFALADLSKAGFTVIRKEDPFVDRTQIKGDYMWLVVAEKN
jgi:ubiquinone/menaquinone biosynthesis C-methylase UbiE